MSECVFSGHFSRLLKWQVDKNSVCQVLGLSSPYDSTEICWELAVYSTMGLWESNPSAIELWISETYEEFIGVETNQRSWCGTSSSSIILYGYL